MYLLLSEILEKLCWLYKRYWKQEWWRISSLVLFATISRYGASIRYKIKHVFKPLNLSGFPEMEVDWHQIVPQFSICLETTLNKRKCGKKFKSCVVDSVECACDQKRKEKLIRQKRACVIAEHQIVVQICSQNFQS